VQLAPTARLVPQLFPNIHEDASVPVTAMLEIDNTAVPVFVAITVWDPLDVPRIAEPKDKFVSERVIGNASPVPFNVIVSGEPCAGVIFTVAVRAPTELNFGVKATEIVQLARPVIANPRLPPQVCVSVKSLALVPPSEML